MNPARAVDVRRHHEAGRAAHPGLPLGFEEYAARVGAHAERRVRRGGEEPTEDAVRALLPRMAGEDLFLAIACDRKVPGAWERLVTSYRGRLVALAKARGLPAAAAEEVVDDLLQDLALAPPDAGESATLLGTYGGTGSLFGWLATILLKRLWRRRRDPRAARGGETAVEEGPPAAEEGASPEAAALSEEGTQRFREAFAAAWGRCTRNERLALLAAHHGGLLHRQIARLLGVGRPRVTRLLSTGVRRIREAVRASLGDEAPQGRRAWLDLQRAVEEHLERMAPLEGGDAPTLGERERRSDDHRPE